MVECGICGNNQHRLYCGGCAAHLTLRARINVIKVTSQLAELQANVTQAIEGSPANKSNGLDNSGSYGNEARTVQLHAQINLLQKRLAQIQSVVIATQDKTAAIKQQHNSIVMQTSAARLRAHTMDLNAQAQYEAAEKSRNLKESQLEKGYRNILHLSLGVQSKVCHDLLDIFSLKKKRKKGGYEIVLGFNVVPELSQLGHYSLTTINSGLERVSMFIFLFASYLGLRLPYEIKLPQKAQPKVLIGPSHIPLWLPHSIKTMMRSSPREFHTYCRLISMLALNVAFIALKLGISGVSELQDIARLNQLVAQIYLRVESLIRAGHAIQIYSGTIAADLDAMQDHIITAIDIELNGKSAEWNIIESPQ